LFRRVSQTLLAPVLVGFAVETADPDGLVTLGRAKLRSKSVDIVVANHASDSFGRDDNRAVLVTADDAQPLDVLSKRALADRILDRVRQSLDAVPR
jgi:phosphopantothenoylcysteine decarboxylase/phosphopantothenate--cysteine ligase